MNDQAERLRNLVRRHRAARPKQTRVITVTSGKGGVGKSNFTLNFALGLQARGYDSLVFDADIGLANIDVLMGVSPGYSLYHLLKKEKTIWEIIQQGPRNLRYIAGGSGFYDLFRLSDQDLDFFTRQIEQLYGDVDYILFDTGAGLSKETVSFILAADETILVTTPEPTAITDAYATVKMIHGMEPTIPFKLVINRAADNREGMETADKISMAAKRFLGTDIHPLGYIPDDASVSKAVKQQIPFSLAFPHCAAARGIDQIVSRFLAGTEAEGTDRGGMKGFIRRIVQMFR
jgi:flagellar biosynthesis protein FlhG